MAKGDVKVRKRTRTIDGEKHEDSVRIAIVGKADGSGEHEHPFDGETAMPDGERFIRWARE